MSIVDPNHFSSTICKQFNALTSNKIYHTLWLVDSFVLTLMDSWEADLFDLKFFSLHFKNSNFVGKCECHNNASQKKLDSF